MDDVSGKVVIGRRWQFGPCHYLEVSRNLIVNGQTVELESKPLDVLVHLLEHSTEVVKKEYLLEAVWGSTSEQSLTTAISKIRKAIGGKRDSIILNIAGVGYRMAVPVICSEKEERRPASFRLEIGQPIPNRPEWKAIRQLGRNEASPVWLARHDGLSEDQVFSLQWTGSISGRCNARLPSLA